MPEKVGFEEWKNIDLRAGKIVGVEDIENADNLFKLKADVGEDNPRVLVAALKPYYTKEELEGKRCVVFCNLEAKVLKGIKSQGMVLAAVNEDKSKVRLIQPDDEVELGSSIE